MSLGNVFSSSGKQAQQAAANEGAIGQQMVSQIENYTTEQQQKLRDAIGGMGPNPYFSAAQQMSPSAYAVNPQGTATFGVSGPGTTTAQPNVSASPVQAPPPQPGAVGMPPNEPRRPEPQPPQGLPRPIGGPVGRPYPIPMNAFQQREAM